jgi:integrase
MASVRKNARGSWLARWVDASGVRRSRAAVPNTRLAAKALAEELQLNARRQQEGLTPRMPRDGGGTVGALLEWWLESYSHRLASHASNEGSVRRHLLTASLAELRLGACSSAAVEAFLDAKEREGLRPQTVNHLRAFLSRAFAAAIRVGRWPGANPVTLVRKRKVPKAAVGDHLRVEEVPRVLAQLHPRWRPLFATAIYTGLRKGELAALRREDVDLEARLLVVRRSWYRETTKGGHADAVPIAAALVPWLRDALQQSPSELVFPHVCGTSCPRKSCPGPGGMLSREVALEAVLRRALGRAGIVRGWKHVCRRRGCRHKEPASDAFLRRCPKCNMRLWPKPVVRPIRFHDLRHTTATLLLREKVPLVVVQKVLRHRDPKLTEQVYGHLADDLLRDGVDRLHFDGMPEPASVPSIAFASGSGTPAGPNRASMLNGPESRGENSRTSDPFDLSGRRGSNPRPSAWEADALPLSYSRERPVGGTTSGSGVQAGFRGRTRAARARPGCAAPAPRARSPHTSRGDPWRPCPAGRDAARGAGPRSGAG